VGRFSAVYRASETFPAQGPRGHFSSASESAAQVPRGQFSPASEPAPTRAVALRLLKVRRNTTPSERTIIIERLRGLTQPIADIAVHCPALAPTTEVAGLVAGGRWMPVMVQAWVEGETLESLLVSERQREVPPRSLARVIDLLTPLADALGYAHSRSLVHGSLSPRNVVVRDLVRDGWKSLEVLDLGVSQALATVQARDVAFDDEAGARIFFFAPAYGSPEHFADSLPALTPASDVFSLALMTVEMVTGRAPLGEGDDEALERASVDPAVRPTPRPLGRDFGSFVEAIFERALAVDPRERYATVSSFWDALRAASRMSTVRPARSVRPPPLPDGESGRSSARFAPLETSLFDAIDPFPEQPPNQKHP
jgi:serine/threonine-protein kinase